MKKKPENIKLSEVINMLQEYMNEHDDCPVAFIDSTHAYANIKIVDQIPCTSIWDGVSIVCTNKFWGGA